MARFLLAWELGGGLGHLDKLRAIGCELLRRGHSVIAAIREMIHADEVFGGTGIDFIPAPAKTIRTADHVEVPCCYAHILHNTCFADDRSLKSQLQAWHSILKLTRADMVVAEHSPTAILACRGRGIRVARLGTGFTCPPATDPLPVLPRMKHHLTDEEVRLVETRMLDRINGILRCLDVPLLSQLRENFATVDLTVLATYPEIDHFGPRENEQYWGIWQNSYGVPPQWPRIAGSKVFAYLKPFKAVEHLLGLLRDSQIPTLVVSDGLEPALLERMSGRNVRFETRPVEIRQAAAECELAVLNAGHGSAATMLLAGKPMLLIPLFHEQLLLARRVEEMGAGRSAPPDDGKIIARELQKVLGSAAFTTRARAFADRYRDHHKNHRLTDLVDQMEMVIR